MSWRSVADFQKFLSPPDLLEDGVLYSGAAIIPGGFDHQGSPLVIVPRAQQSKLVSDLKIADIVKLFKYFLHHLSESQNRNCLISIVADLRCATLDVVSSIINSLLQIQCQFGKIVDTFYTLQPQKKGIKKCMLKSLGLGHSKPFSEPPFKCVLLNEVFELFNYIDRSQLTSDLGGYLVYQHAAWAHFRKDIDGFIREYCTVMQRFPGFLALLQELSLQSLPAGAEEFQWLPHELQELYSQGRRDIGIDELLRWCEMIVEKLRNPKADPFFLAMAGTALFAQTVDEMYERNERIRAAVDKVELLWQQALSRAQLLLKDFQCKQKARRIINLITKESLGKVRAYKVEIANNFSQAEILKLKYEDAIYNPAMELVVESERVLYALSVLTEEGLKRDEDLWEKLSRLKETLNVAVEVPYKTLKAVCDFNYTFEKVINWYHLVLEQIIFKEAAHDNSVPRLGLPQHAVTSLKPGWQRHVNHIFKKVPLPDVKDFVQLRHLANDIPDVYQRRQGKLLSHQGLILRKLLTSQGHVLLVHLEQAIEWQKAYLKRSQSTVLHHSNSPIDTKIIGSVAEDMDIGTRRFWKPLTNKASCEAKKQNSTAPYTSSAERDNHETDQIGHISDYSHFDQKLNSAVFPSACQNIVHFNQKESKTLSTKPSSLTSFDSGIDGAGSCNFKSGNVKDHCEMSNQSCPTEVLKPPLKTNMAELDRGDNVGEMESEWSEFKRLGFSDSFPISSVLQASPDWNPKTLDFEMKVRHSAGLHKNAWIGLPVEDFEKSYMVTITPKRLGLKTNGKLTEVSQNVTHQIEQTHLGQVTKLSPTLNRSEAIKTRSVVMQAAVDQENILVLGECSVHTVEKPSSQESGSKSNLSPIKNSGIQPIFKESFTEEPHISDILWGSYNLPESRRLFEGASNERTDDNQTEDRMLSDWEMREQENLQDDVEKLLLKTTKILEEEECVLRQEEELEFLLQTQVEEEQSDNDLEENSTVVDMSSDPGSMKSDLDVKVTMSLKELSDAGVIGLEDFVWSEIEEQESDYCCTHSSLVCDIKCMQQERGFHSHCGFNIAGSSPGAHLSQHNNPRLHQELKELCQIEDRIFEESLKLRELCRSEEEHENFPNQITPESDGGRLNPSEDRIKFLSELERERKEVEKMEQTLAREEQIKSRNLRKLPHKSTKSQHGSQKTATKVVATNCLISNLAANLRTEVTKQSELTETNLEIKDFKPPVNSVDLDSNCKDTANRQVSSYTPGSGNKRDSKLQNSKIHCGQDQVLVENKDLYVNEEYSLINTKGNKLLISQKRPNESCIILETRELQMCDQVEKVDKEETQGKYSHETNGLFSVTEDYMELHSFVVKGALLNPTEIHTQQNNPLHFEANSLLHKEENRMKEVHSTENKTFGDSERFTSECNDTTHQVIKTKQKLKGEAQTNLSWKVEKFPISSSPQQSVSKCFVVEREVGSAVQLRVPVPKPRGKTRQNVIPCQKETVPAQHLRNSTDLRKTDSGDSDDIDDHHELSEIDLKTCPMSQKLKYQETISSETAHEMDLSLWPGNKYCATELKPDHTSRTSNTSDLTELQINQLTCKKNDCVPELTCLIDSITENMNSANENSDICVGENDSRLAVKPALPREDEHDMTQTLGSNEAKSRIAAGNRSLTPEVICRSGTILQSSESRSLVNQKESLNMMDVSVSGCINNDEDFHNEEVHSSEFKFDSLNVNVSGTRNPMLDTHIFQASVMKVSDYNTPIVLDTGSGLLKAGFADQDLPTTIFPTVIGRPKYEDVSRGRFERDFYVGNDAQHMRGVLSLYYPMEHGVVNNWDEMEKIWHHAFYHQLRIEPEEHPVLLTEAAMNPHQNRERMVEILFDSFNVPFSYVAMQAVLALYSSGRTTGVILDSGDGVTHTVPVYEGYSLPHAIQRLNLAGRDLTEYLKQLLKEKGYSFNTSAEQEIVREIKEKHCCVALDFDEELSNSERFGNWNLHYTLPDGQIIAVGNERFRAPEILFRPEMIGKDHYGIHESLLRSIIRCDIDLRKTFVGNIILSGGNTMLTGLPARIQKEIRSTVPLDLSTHVHVASPANRDFTVWSGGAVLASSRAFQSAWISRQEYGEYGSNIVHRKCF